MKNNALWIIALITVGWLTFLLGYSMASLSGIEQPAATEAPQPEAGGYGR